MLEVPSVAILIVNWNRCQDTLECLQSLSRLTYPNFRVVVVDNGSSDGSVAGVRSQYPQVTLIEAGQNFRYAGGNNLGLREILKQGDDFALLLNNDTTVAPDFLDHLIAAVQRDPPVGLVGGKILYYNRPKVIWFAGGVIRPAWGYVRHWGLRQLDSPRFNRPREVSFLTGCCLLIRRDLLEKIGFLDEGFYLYSEDADYCLRASQAGSKLFYEPRAKIYHKVSSSTGGAYNWRKWWQRYLSLFRLVRKHTSPLTWPLFGLNLFWEIISLPLIAYLQTRRLPSVTSQPTSKS